MKKIHVVLLTALCGAALFAVWTALSPGRERDTPAGREAQVLEPGRTPPAVLEQVDPESVREALEREPEETQAHPAPKLATTPDEREGWILQGRLVAESGAQHADLGGPIEIVDADGRTQETRAKDGAYRIEDFAAGRWWVTPRLPGWRGETREIVLPRGNGTHVLDLVLHPIPRIRVEAFALDGTPLLSAMSRLGISVPARPKPIATLDPPADGTVDPERGLGQFRVAPQAQAAEGLLGDIELEAPASVFVSLVLYEIVVATLEVPEGVASARFEVDPNLFANFLTTLRFEVMEAHTGRPVTDCMVLLSKGPSSMMHMLEEQNRGLFEQPDWPIGRFELRLTGTEYEEYQAEYELEARAVNDLGLLLLRPARKLTGRVVLPTGIQGEESSLAEAHISFERVNETPEIAPSILLAQGCEEDGSFSVPLGTGRYRIWARVWWSTDEELHSRQHYFDTENDRLDDVRIPLLRQAELVARPDATVPNGTWIVIRDESGHRWARRRLQAPKPLRLSLPDSYRLILEDGEGGPLGELPLELEWPGVDLALGL